MAVMAEYLFWLAADPSKFTLINKASIRKVLIIHLGALGEILAATPMLLALKHELKAQVKFMVAPGRENILENNPYVDEVITYQQSFKKNLERLKKEKFDLAIVLWPTTLKFSWLCLRAGIKYRIAGFKNVQDIVNLFFTRRLLDLRKKHTVVSNLKIIRILGIDNKNPKMEFYPSKKNIRNADAKLKKIKAVRYIIIHPGFSFAAKYKYPSRYWPPERYAEVAETLVKKYKIKVLLTGTREEKQFSEQILKKARNKKDILITNDLFSLGELAAVISNAKMIIVTNTGILHLAAAFDTPIIELSGKEDPVEWGPWRTRAVRVISHPEVCTECDRLYCRKKTIECMMSIKTEEVIKAADSFLAKKKK